MKSKLTALLRVVVSFGLLGLLFWLMRSDIGAIWHTIAEARLEFILLGAMLFLVAVCVLSYRMKIIFEGEDLSISMNQSVQLNYMGYFFNNFMPTAVGGDIIKAHYAAKVNKQRLKSYASVLMDRFLGLYTYLIIAGVALFVDGGQLKVAALKPTVFALLAAGLIGFVVIADKRVAHVLTGFLSRVKLLGIGDKLNSIYEIVHDYRNRQFIIGKSIMVSIVAQSLYFTMVYMFFRAIGYDVGFGNVFLVMPIVTFVSMIPSVGGLGVREGAIVALFAPFVGREAAFAVSLLLLFSLLLVSLIGGILYLWWMVTGKTDKKDKEL